MACQLLVQAEQALVLLHEFRCLLLETRILLRELPGLALHLQSQSLPLTLDRAGPEIRYQHHGRSGHEDEEDKEPPGFPEIGFYHYLARVFRQHIAGQVAGADLEAEPAAWRIVVAYELVGAAHLPPLIVQRIYAVEILYALRTVAESEIRELERQRKVPLVHVHRPFVREVDFTVGGKAPHKPDFRLPGIFRTWNHIVGEQHHKTFLVSEVPVSRGLRAVSGRIAEYHRTQAVPQAETLDGTARCVDSRQAVLCRDIDIVRNGKDTADPVVGKAVSGIVELRRHGSGFVPVKGEPPDAETETSEPDIASVVYIHAETGPEIVILQGFEGRKVYEQDSCLRSHPHPVVRVYFCRHTLYIDLPVALELR